MWKKKKFILVNENYAVKKRKNAYEPKPRQWMTYAVVPCIIGFMLLLILMNVDFSGKLKVDITSKEMSSSRIATETTLMSVVPERRSYNLQLYTYAKMVGAARCENIRGDLCTIVCVNGVTGFIDDDLETIFQPHCGGELSLIIKNCTFPLKQFTPMFSGFYRLKSLEISTSDFIEILDGAFKTTSMERLLTLSLSTTDLKQLTDKSFGGLNALKELNLTNISSLNKFLGIKFLQPIAKSLQKVRLIQESIDMVYDPLSWLDGKNKFSNLERVNLSGNNFANTLSRETFCNLQAVRQLILANSSITTLPTDTFADVVDSLDYLDLSLNSLRNLKVSGLLSTHKSGLHLELYGNPWSCSCENLELITALKAGDFTYDQEPLCATPPDLKDKLLKEVELKCGDEQPPITIEPPLTKPSSTPTPDRVETPNTTQNSTISTTVTTTTPTLPDEKSTPSTSSSSPTLNPEETPNTSPNSTVSTTVTSTFPSIPDESSVPEPMTTPDSTKMFELTCKLLSNSSENFNILVRHFDDRFIIQTISSTSVVIFIPNNVNHLSLAYLSTNNRTYLNSIVIRETRAQQNSIYEFKSTSFTVIQVNDLFSNETYIFCLVPMTELNTSPFNCQSHFMGSEIYKDSEVWLQINDQAWFLTVIIFAMAFAVCLGMLSIYWLLRWRPTWLRGCKRVINVDDSKSHQVYLLPKTQYKSSDDSYYESERNNCENRINLTLDYNSHDYMQFYKSLQEGNRNRKVHALSSMMAPKEVAPAIPENQSQSRTVSMQSTIPADDLRKQHEIVADENEYQSIDYYEHLF